MAHHESPSVSVSRRGHRLLGSDPLRTVVWVGGEHDLATSVHLSDTIAQAARLDDADIFVDLSGVTFMDASTIGVLVAARDRLRFRSRSLSVRAPSPRARRLLDLCGLAGMIDEPPAPRGLLPAAAAALGSWVDVPVSDRGPDSTQPPVTREAPSQEPAHATARRGGESAGSAQRRRAPS